MAVTGHKIYVTGNIAYIDEIVDSGSAMQFEGLAKNCLPRKKYVDSTEFSFSGFNGLDETKAFPFAQLKDGNGDAWADQATFEAWATSNLGKPSAGDSALTTDQIDAINSSNSPSVSNVFATMADVGGGSVKKEFVMYIGSQNATGFTGTSIKSNTCDTTFTFTRDGVGAFAVPQFDPTIHLLSYAVYNPADPMSLPKVIWWPIQSAGHMYTFDGVGDQSDFVFTDGGGWIKIEQY